MKNGKHVRLRTALIDGQSVKTKHKVTSNITPQSLHQKFSYIPYYLVVRLIAISRD